MLKLILYLYFARKPTLNYYQFR